jgi:hypothetical protein
MGRALGRTRWAIPEGWLPAYAEGKGGRALESHEAACLLDASVIESDVPIVVQHTRLDARQAETALLSTIAFAGE